MVDGKPDGSARARGEQTPKLHPLRTEEPTARVQNAVCDAGLRAESDSDSALLCSIFPIRLLVGTQQLPFSNKASRMWIVSSVESSTVSRQCQPKPAAMALPCRCRGLALGTARRRFGARPSATRLAGVGATSPRQDGRTPSSTEHGHFVQWVPQAMGTEDCREQVSKVPCLGSPAFQHGRFRCSGINCLDQICYSQHQKASPRLQFVRPRADRRRPCQTRPLAKLDD